LLNNYYFLHNIIQQAQNDTLFTALGFIFANGKDWVFIKSTLIA